MKYQISEDLIKGLLTYLASRPYSEVHQGITALQNLKPIGEKHVKPPEADTAASDTSSA